MTDLSEVEARIVELGWERAGFEGVDLDGWTKQYGRVLACIAQDEGHFLYGLDEVRLELRSPTLDAAIRDVEWLLCPECKGSGNAPPEPGWLPTCSRCAGDGRGPYARRFVHEEES